MGYVGHGSNPLHNSASCVGLTSKSDSPVWWRGTCHLRNSHLVEIVKLTYEHRLTGLEISLFRRPYIKSDSCVVEGHLPLEELSFGGDSKAHI